MTIAKEVEVEVKEVISCDVSPVAMFFVCQDLKLEDQAIKDTIHSKSVKIGGACFFLQQLVEKSA